jgi:hypothetical protein
MRRDESMKKQAIMPLVLALSLAMNVFFGYREIAHDGTRSDGHGGAGMGGAGIAYGDVGTVTKLLTLPKGAQNLRIVVEGGGGWGGDGIGQPGQHGEVIINPNELPTAR